MDVDGRRYVLSNLETATNLISGIGKVLVLMLTQNILAMQLLYCLCSMLPIPVILWYTHKNYPWIDHHAKPDYSAVAQKNSVLMHQLSGVIFNNTDMVLLSYFCNFQLVSVYSIYNMFFVQIVFVMNLFLTASRSGWARSSTPTGSGSLACSTCARRCIWPLSRSATP